MQVAFQLAGKASARELRSALRDVAEPVRSDAETLARSGLKVSKVNWTLMRTGSNRTMVYVAPKQRGRFSKKNPRLKRRNAAPKIARAMERSLAQNTGEINVRMERVLSTIDTVWGK